MQWIIENPVYDSSQTDKLNLFSFSPSLKVSASAIGILLANNASNYSEPYSVIDESKHSDPIKLKNEKRVENYLVVVPNPATDFITIKYASKFRTSKLYIYNDAGKLLLKRNLHKEQDEITLSTRGFNPGIYLISLKNDQGFTKSSKFIISR